MVTLYGIKNCDSVKKARRWLTENKIDYEFIDFRENAIDKKLLTSWVMKMGLDVIINKRSTSWRALKDSQKENLNNQNAVDLLAKVPTLIKRPVVTLNGNILVGFSLTRYNELLK